MSSHIVLIEAAFKPQDVVCLKINRERKFVVSAYKILTLDAAGQADMFFYEVYDEDGERFNFTEADLELIEEYKTEKIESALNFIDFKPDSNIILKAAYFAAFKHRNQRRKNKEASPYINHPLHVAILLSEIGKVQDSDIIAAALLHDTIEDTNTKPDELDELFGKRVRKIVEEVTDDKNLPQNERKRRQIEHSSELSSEAVLIKLGDKISNVMDVTNNPPADWDLERRQNYFDWAEAVINNCPSTNLALEEYFRTVVEAGREKLLI